MRSVARRVALNGLIGSVVMIWSAHKLTAERSPTITMARLYTGSDGQTHAGTAEVRLRASTLRAGLDESEPVKASATQLLRWPPGYVWDWHTASQRQYVITLSGRGEVELAGEQKIQLNPGRIILAEDVAGKGHITRSLGPGDMVLLIVPLGPP